MALTNAQYNTVMRDYERQQLSNRREQERRVAEVYKKVPEVRELDLLVSAEAAACAKRLLEGDTKARDLLKQKLSEIGAKRTKLLIGAGFSADYMEMHYRCPECKDTGYADGKRCRCFERARIRILYDQSNLSEVLGRENFSTLSYACYDDKDRLQKLGMTEREYMKLVVKQCREFAETFPDNEKNLLFTGSTGVGKTFLTNCIAKELIDRYVSVIYLASQDLFEILSRYKFDRDSEEDMEETYHHILDCDMLIVDDLGTELNNTFVSSQLFYCINERILRKKGTIISTNLSMSGLRDMYSDRVTSRLMSSYRMIPLYGSDIRLKKRYI